MRGRLRLLMTGALMLSLPWLASADPFTCDDTANTCTYQVSFKEPTTKQGGAPLDNYKQSNIKTALNAGTFQTTVKLASAPAGGGSITQNFTFATVPCGVTSFTVKVSGSNTVNVEGPETAPVTVQRDRTLDPLCAPAAPSNLVVN